MEFSRQEYWSGYPLPSLGDLPNPGIEPGSLALQEDSLPFEPPGTPKEVWHKCIWLEEPNFKEGWRSEVWLPFNWVEKSSNTRVFRGSGQPIRIIKVQYSAPVNFSTLTNLSQVQYSAAWSSSHISMDDCWFPTLRAGNLKLTLLTHINPQLLNYLYEKILKKKIFQCSFYFFIQFTFYWAYNVPYSRLSWGDLVHACRIW